VETLETTLVDMSPTLGTHPARAADAIAPTTARTAARIVPHPFASISSTRRKWPPNGAKFRLLKAGRAWQAPEAKKAARRAAPSLAAESLKGGKHPPFALT
jgi:hypothetical protein